MAGSYRLTNLSSLGCEVTVVLYDVIAQHKMIIEEGMRKYDVNIIFASTEKLQIPTKTRFISNYKDQKMFEVSQIKSFEVHTSDLKLLTDEIEKRADNFDMIIGLNYGHGMWSNQTFKTDNIKIFAMNYQTNSENYGFQFIYAWHSPITILILDEKASPGYWRSIFRNK